MAAGVIALSAALNMWGLVELEGLARAAVGRATARADAPGGREADAERFSALIKALRGREPKVYCRSDGRIDIICGREHLDGFARYAELTDAVRR